MTTKNEIHQSKSLIYPAEMSRVQLTCTFCNTRFSLPVGCYTPPQCIMCKQNTDFDNAFLVYSCAFCGKPNLRVRYGGYFTGSCCDCCVIDKEEVFGDKLVKCNRCWKRFHESVMSTNGNCAECNKITQTTPQKPFTFAPIINGALPNASAAAQKTCTICFRKFTPTDKYAGDICLRCVDNIEGPGGGHVNSWQPEWPRAAINVPIMQNVKTICKTCSRVYTRSQYYNDDICYMCKCDADVIRPPNNIDLETTYSTVTMTCANCGETYRKPPFSRQKLCFRCNEGAQRRQIVPRIEELQASTQPSVLSAVANLYAPVKDIYRHRAIDTFSDNESFIKTCEICRIQFLKRSSLECDQCMRCQRLRYTQPYGVPDDCECYQKHCSKCVPWSFCKKAGKLVYVDNYLAPDICFVCKQSKDILLLVTETSQLICVQCVVDGINLVGTKKSTYLGV